MKYKNKVLIGDCASILQNINEESVDLTVTSPPYDSVRDYTGYVFNYQQVIDQLYIVTKLGGVVVWVVADEVRNQSETGTSFKHALYFIDAGFNLHDTMIYQKQNFMPANVIHRRYAQSFEYMFVLSKGLPKTFNPIMDKTKFGGQKLGSRTFRQKDGSLKTSSGEVAKEKIRSNVWPYNIGWMMSTTDEIAFEHPAIFPMQLAKDHINTWSNKGDLVLDPMCGSGTTLKAAKELGRNYIGIDISPEYCALSNERVAQEVIQF